MLKPSEDVGFSLKTLKLLRVCAVAKQEFDRVLHLGQARIERLPDLSHASFTEFANMLITFIQSMYSSFSCSVFIIRFYTVGVRLRLGGFVLSSV